MGPFFSWGVGVGMYFHELVYSYFGLKLIASLIPDDILFLIMQVSFFLF